MNKLDVNKIIGSIADAMVYKKHFEECVKVICDFLTENSPSNNLWYYHCGSFRVDVQKEDYDKYMDFLNGLVDCSYTHIVNDGGLTYMFSLSTFYEKVMKE